MVSSARRQSLGPQQAAPASQPHSPVAAPLRSARLWTADRVPLTLPLAGLGERALAYLVDLAILVAGLLGGLFVYNFWGDLTQDVSALGTLGFWLLALTAVSAVLLYDTLSEVVFAGRTVGKRVAKLRVIRRDGLPPDVFTALVRNAMRLIDFFPFGYATGVVALFLTGTRRVGDLVADTYVVTEQARSRDPLHHCETAAAGAATAPITEHLDDAHVLQALEVVDRTAGVRPHDAEALCHRVLAQLLPAAAAHTQPAVARATLAAAVLAQAKAGSGVAGHLQQLRAAAHALERALSSPQGTTASVASLEDTIRQASSVLMRATRRAVPAHHLERLSLALLLVEQRRQLPARPLPSLGVFLGRSVPQAVYAERALVWRAASVLVLGLLVGGVVAFADAEVARELLSDRVARGIEDGARWTDTIEVQGAFAQTSLAIIVNNVSVGVRVFVLGLLGGVATVLGVFVNGLQLGAVFGYAFRLGTASTLLRFIAAHGPVELTMICVAAAGGLCLGRAILRPGNRTRLDALRSEGATGAKLFCASALGFVVVGGVEGFISPGAAFPVAFNIALGLLLWLIFVAWVLLAPREQPAIRE